MNTQLILVADDDDDIRRLVSSIVEHQGYKALEAENGAIALSRARLHQPVLAIIDNLMPGTLVDGCDLARALREDPDTRDMGILMLSARTHTDDVVQGLEQGADDYIKKPFHVKELSARVAALLRRLALDVSESRQLSAATAQPTLFPVEAAS